MMEQYRKHRILSSSDAFFEQAHDIYTRSFPPHEQRTLDGLQKTLGHPDFRYLVFLDGQDNVIAIRNTWHTPAFAYLEHFAVSPNARSGGIGKYLLQDLTSEAPGKVILEIDPVTDEISTRRLNFYLRNGFVANEQYDYIHPPYKPEDLPYPLLIMSHLEPLPQNLYDEFENYHHTTVVEKPPHPEGEAAS